MQSKPRVFISYARADGEAFATALRRRLEAERRGLTLWQDRSEMEGGRSWWSQIVDALDEVEFLVLVMTPAALRSEYTRKEWQYARQQGVCVYPVKATSDTNINYDSLPRWMRKAHFFDLEQEWDTFVRYLQSPCRATRVPFMAPELPNSYVQRTSEFLQLLSQLKEHDRSTPLTISTTLRGAGGFGKTTLAAALCHNEEVIAAFEDGILWITLGEQPNLLRALTKLYAALTDERPTFIDADEAGIRFAEKLEGKHCLIVLDDLWNTADLLPFLRGGIDSLRLITTRNFDVGYSGRCVNVDEMTEDESVQILSAQLSLRSDEVITAQKLVRRLGEWPLLLSLANAALQHRVKRGESVARAFSYLQRALDERGVTAFDQRNPTQREHAIAKSVNVSLDLLTPEERDCYLALSIFPEDTDVPFTTIGALWGLNDFSAEALAQSLDTFSLLKMNLQTGSIRLHDVMRAYLTKEVGDAAHLHAKLLERWGDMESLPDDYAWRWLGYHLTAANRSRELRDLLCNISWLQAKLDATDVTNLIADFEWIPRDSDLEAIRNAIRQSAIILLKDKTQLPAQLHWRLASNESPEIRGVLGGQPSEPRAAYGAANTLPSPPLIRTWQGHSDAVNSLAVTADGTRLISASSDRAIKVWDFDRGGELRCFGSHLAGIASVILTPDDQRAISGAADGNVIEWDLQTGLQLRSFKGHAGWITALTLRDNRLVSASFDGTLKIWDLQNGSEIGCFMRGPGITSLELSFDASIMLAARSDGSIALIDCADGRELRALKGHTAGVTGVLLTRGGLAISASVDTSIGIWNLEKGVLIQTLRGHTSPVSSITLSSDDRRMASCSSDGTVILWALDSGSAIQHLSVRMKARDPVQAQFERVNKLDDMGSESASRSRGGAVIGEWTCHTGWVSALTMTPDGRRLVSASVDGVIKVWDIQWMAEEIALKESGRWQLVDADPRAVAITRDGSGILTWTDKSEEKGFLTNPFIAKREKGSLALWSVKVPNDPQSSASSGTIVGRRANKFSPERAIDCEEQDVVHVAIGHDRKTALCVSKRGRLTLWNMLSGEMVGAFDIGDGNATLNITPDSRFAVAGGSKGGLSIWDLAVRSKVRTINTSGVPIAVAGAFDARRLISLCDDGTLSVWDGKTSHTLQRLFGHWKTGSVSITPGGDMALSGHSASPAITVWDLENGRVIGVLVDNNAGITAVALSANGQRANAFSNDGSVAVWDLVTHDRIAVFRVQTMVQGGVLASDSVSLVTARTWRGIYLFRAWEIWPR